MIYTHKSDTLLKLVKHRIDQLQKEHDNSLRVICDMGRVELYHKETHRPMYIIQFFMQREENKNHTTNFIIKTSKTGVYNEQKPT